MLIAETWLDHLARELRLPPNAIREKNMYRAEGDRTHFNQPLPDCQIRNVWAQLLATADYESMSHLTLARTRTHI